MLPEWYFCCCIESSPDQTQAFLSVLETLSNPESSRSSIYLAYQELCKTEIWLQIYALPSVLESLQRQNVPDSIRDIITPYWQALVDQIPASINAEENGFPFTELIDLVLPATTRDFQTLKKRLETCTQELKRLEYRTPSSTPYLDLKEFTPEILLLAMTAHCVSRDKYFSFQLAMDFSESQSISSLQKVIEDALDYKFGRLPFLIAAKVAPLVLSNYVKDKGKILSFISKNQLSVAEIEPDLLSACAKLLFLDPATEPDAGQKEDIVKSVIAEAFDFRYLRQYFKYFPKRASNSNEPIRRIGLEASSMDVGKSLQLVFWQAILWDLALQIDPQATANALSEYWRPPSDEDNRGDLFYQGDEKSVSEWQQQIQSLFDLRVPKQREQIRVKKADNLVIPEMYKHLIFSPWIVRLKSGELGRIRKDINRYPESDRPASLIRLVAGAIIAVKLLQRLPDEAQVYSEYASLIVHVSDVIYTVYRRWLQDYDKEQPRSGVTKLSRQLTGLVLFGRRQVNWAGCGRSESISPKKFVDILNQTSNKDSAFLETVLPEVLILWIVDGFAGAVNRDTGPGRWLNFIPEVYEHQPASQKMRSGILAALTRKLLSPDEPFEGDKSFDWRSDKDKEGNPIEWRLDHRLLLLTERGLHPDEWLKKEWYEPEESEWQESETQNNKIYTQSTHLVRSIERIASLLEYPEEIPKDIIADWWSDWRYCLNRINKNEELDRFIRLRLLEILDSLKLDYEDQELILALLLEYGGAYELKRIVQTIYPDKEIKEPSSNNTQRDVRKFLLRTLYRELEKADLDYIETGRRQYAQDPRMTLWDFQKADIIKETFAKIAYLELYGCDKKQSGELSTLISLLRNESREKESKPTTQMVKADVLETENAGVKERRVLLPENAHIQNWSIRGAAFDPNMLTMTAFFDDINTDGITNLFEYSEKELSAFLDGVVERSSCVLAVVVNEQVTQDGGLERVFNCGLPFYLSLITPASSSKIQKKPEFKPGDYVALPIFKSRGNDRWYISDKEKIGLLHPKLRLNQMESLIVVESEKERTNPKRRDLYVKDGKDNIDLKLWDADVSRVFRTFPEKIERPVFARLNSQNSRAPIDQDFIDFVLKGFQYNTHQIAVLTLIDTLSGTFGDTAWRFSIQPGENYVLEESQFTAEDAARLRAEIQKLESQNEHGSHGLLVTVTMTLDFGKVNLRLADVTGNDSVLDSHYPNLQAPFDYRNITWRYLFTETETEIAKRREDTRWYVDLGSHKVPGYPDYIPVEWGKFWPERDESIAIFTPAWNEENQRKATVGGESLKIHRITPADGNWGNFFNRWINVKEGDQIALVELQGRDSPRDGSITCLTNEQVAVKVDVESLTMRPRPPAIRGGQRIAQITNVSKFFKPTPPLLDTSDIPSEAIIGGKCEGILLEVPVVGTQCMVLWRTLESTKPSWIHIQNISDVKPHSNDRIFGSIDRDGWNFSLQSRIIRACALWSIEESAVDSVELCYLGTVDYSGETRAIAEWQPGKLVLLSVPKGVRHLATGDGITFSHGLPSQCTVTNSAQGGKWKEGRNEYTRAVLSILSQGINGLRGICDANLPPQNLCLVDVSILLTRGKGQQNLFLLQRYFRLREMIETVTAEKQSGDEDIKINEERLKGYFDNPSELPAKFQKDVVTLINFKVPANADHTRWTQHVPLAPGEGTFILDNIYSYDAMVVLFRDTADGQIYASFRRVSPFSPDEYKRKLDARFDEYMSLEENLFYIGPEEADPVTGDAYNELHHRFEWGYGKTLLVQESKLTYNQLSFSNSKFLLFHGDKINGITFIRDTTQDLDMMENGDEDVYPSCIIDIETFSVEFSQARSLFSQRNDYKIVHILHLSLEKDDRVAIAYVEGFDEKGIYIEKPDTQTGTRVFDRVSAQLSPDSQKSILNRMKRKGNTRGQLTVLGRLDTERYRSTSGQSVVFDHVRLSFQPSEEGSPLQDGELVFMQSGDIIKIPNDMALVIHPLSILDKVDVSNDMRESLLPRRHFSTRESLLPRISEKLGFDGLKGSILLVKLDKKDGGGAWTSMKENIPPRTSEALSSAIAGRKAPLFAAVVDYIPGENLVIELKPGIFVRLRYDDISNLTSGLTKGSLIRIESASDKKFSITRATFGEARYIVGDLRSVVALPNESLQDEIAREDKRNNDAYWRNVHGFIIGSFPNIVASPGQYDTKFSRWLPPNSKSFISLMEKPHPKIVLLGWDKVHNEFRVSVPLPYFRGSYAGKLKRDGQKFDVKYVSLEEHGSFNAQTLDWRLLSFGDESVKEILERASREAWRYHDLMTGTWSSASNRIFRNPLGKHDIVTGPLFFENASNKFRLRYTKENLLGFGYPVTELINSLKKGATKYPVAGVSDQGGLWIETSPGRVIELPGEIVVSQTAHGEKSLALLNWNEFAPGDQVELEGAVGDAFEIDRVALKNWIPGPRKAFGPARCFLPVQSYEETTGALRIGAGEYELTIPMETPAFSSGRVILDIDNTIIQADQLFPRVGDVVLVGMDDKERLKILGLPELTPYLDYDAKEIWERDGLFQDTIKITDEDKYYFNQERIKAISKAAGGVLPFTVEKTLQSKQIVFLSRRYQYNVSRPFPGKLLLAHVLDILDQHTALLRCGGGMIKMNVDQLVSGLPASLLPEAIKALRDNHEIIWIRGDDQGKIKVGLNDDRSDSIHVVPIEVLSKGNDVSREAGLICRATDSMILYWLPATHASWTQLSVDQLKHIFIKRPAKVTRINQVGKTDFISIIHTREVEREFNNLSIGSKLTVSVIERNETSAAGPVRNIVESFTSKVVLDCLTYGGKILPERTTMPAEVTRRVKGISCSVTVSPVGQKPVLLDIPSGMLDSLLEPESQRKRLGNYIKRSSSQLNDIPLESTLDNIKALSNEKIEELLSNAYATIDQGIQAMSFQMPVVEEWIRRYRKTPEVNVAFSIMAILLLHKNGIRNLNELKASNRFSDQDARRFIRDCRVKATELAQDLGLRCLRSMHVEILYQNWILNQDRIRRGPMWPRLRQVISELGKKHLSIRDLNALRQFSYALKLRGDDSNDELFCISEALSAATGYMEDPYILYPKTEVTKRLIDIYRTIPKTRSRVSPTLHQDQANQLKQILSYIYANETDIAVLDPLYQAEVNIANSLKTATTDG